MRGEARPLIAQHVMGGHGGLNILGQKSWNVYGQEQRAKVRRDEEEFAAFFARSMRALSNEEFDRVIADMLL